MAPIMSIAKKPQGFHQGSWIALWLTVAMFIEKLSANQFVNKLFAGFGFS